jgi:hypothetical protein
MANHGHYGGKKGATRQGIYVCSPSGKFIASINSTDANKVLEMLEASLVAWQQLPSEDKQLAADAKFKPKHRWEDSFPEDGLVLNMYTRDLPISGDPQSPRAVKWNQDKVWFSASEARQWLPKNLVKTDRYSLPQPLLERVVLQHLVDAVKGQTEPFLPRDIATGTKINISITSIDAQYVKISIHGTTKAESARPSKGTTRHGVAVQIMGSATFNRGQSKFTEFDMVAIGKRWGKTVNNGRRKDEQKSSIGFVFRMAPAGGPRNPPAFVSSYSADWISRPLEIRDEK